MTLPSRRKHRTTALNTRLRERVTRVGGRLFRTALTAALVYGSTAATLAQDPAWRPSRLPAGNQPQRLQARVAQPSSPGSGPNSAFLASRPQALAASPATAEPEQLGSSVVLRWKSPDQAAAQVAGGSQLTATAAFGSSAPRASGSGNPLRPQVRQVNYQQGSADVFSNPFGPDAAGPSTLPQQDLPSLPGRGPAPELPGLEHLGERPQLPDDGGAPFDPLSTPELPPPPSGVAPAPQAQRLPGNTAPRATAPDSVLENNPFPGRGEDASPRDLGSEPSTGNNRMPERRSDIANSSSCNELRSRVRNNPLSAVKLDVSPSYGEGLRSVRKDTEQERLDFAASSQVRQWLDYRGYELANGRLIDLRDDRVVIDVNGVEQSFPLRDLSDVDVAYVGESWNIPERCGTGYEPFAGREFVASTVQFKASGACHKPLYFEQVQLERYGHELGPVLQPLVSTAHFFGTIPVLPYKMGIHPPNECQYSLGYFRPGNCAPYMMQPIPWSLRGAAVQASVVTGAAALIP